MRKFCFLRSNVSPISTIKQDRELGVVSLCWTEISDQNMIINLNCLAATIRSFKMFIDYILDLTSPPHPLLPLPPIYHLPKRTGRQRNCFKIPTSTGIVVAHAVIANTQSKFFHLHLGPNRLSFDWNLLAFSFSNLFLFSFLLPPPPPPPPFKKLTPSWVWAMSRHEWRELASDWLNCTGKPIPCYDTEVSRFDDVKGNWCCNCGTVIRNLVLELKSDTVNKNDDNLPGRAGHWDLHLPDRVSYLPRAVLIVIPWCELVFQLTRWGALVHTNLASVELIKHLPLLSGAPSV